MLDTPIHGNVGDHAIVQTQKQIFADMGVRVVEIPMPELMLREKAFARVIPKKKPIFVPGGGFLGSLWTAEENEFRRILQGFPEHSITVFPQTVTFELDTEDGRKYFEEAKEIYSSHKNLTLYVRDTATLDFMKEHMPKVDCKLVPDTVTVYKPKSESSNRQGILLCFRDDKEKNISDDCAGKILEIVKNRFPGENIVTTDTVNPDPVFPSEREMMVNRKISEFASSKLVVTDRLHGMIMAAITSTPCIAFNNSNGKVKAQYKWLKQNEYVTVVSNSEEFEKAIETVNIDKEYSYDYSYAYEMMKPLLEHVRGKIS